MCINWSNYTPAPLPPSHFSPAAVTQRSPADERQVLAPALHWCDLYLITARQREWANATMDKIVSAVRGNRNFDPIRFRAKIAIFDFDSIIVTSLDRIQHDWFWHSQSCVFNCRGNVSNTSYILMNMNLYIIKNPVFLFAHDLNIDI